MAKILIVDDVAGVRRSIAAGLKRQGHTVLEAVDGVQGLESATREKPDLVIADMLMPEMDGIEMIETLKGRPDCGGIKVLAVSGGGSLVDASEALFMAEWRADATLRKPFDTSELTTAVDALIGRAT